jgi:subtilase family serine protease
MSRLSFTLFRKTPISALLLVGFLNLGTAGILSASEPPKRLHSTIDERSTFALKGHTKPVVQNGLAQDQGEVSSSMVMPRMSIHFAPTSAQQADLDQFLVSVQDRRSASYHKFLTPEQYAARFGVNDADVAKVTAWLESNGFTNLQVARSKTWISFNGSAGQAAEAFHTSIHKYTLNGVPHFANASDPQLPKALDGMVTAVAGLHNFRMKSHIHMRPHFTSSQTGNTFLTPGDWATIYDVKPLYGAGFDGSPLSTAGTACGGSPCSIVVVGQSDVRATDLAAFRSAAGLAAKTVTVVVVPGDRDPGIVNSPTDDDEGESDLDLEWSNGIAKNGNILFVTADATIDNGVEDSIKYAIDNNVAPILSTSYGLCEPEETAADMLSQTSLFQQANAQGMTIVSASGDAGAADCDTGYPAQDGLAVDFPASSPYVTGVGGTTLTVANTTAGGYWGAATSSTVDNISSALQYIPEIVWNDTAADVAAGANELAASGGGASSVYAKPSWQVGTGVPSDGFRDVPDIALAASPNQDGLLICGDGWCTNGFRDGPITTGTLDVTGGTSAGAPTFAGVLAMLVQKTGSPLGNINQNLYTVAGAVSNAFHDITSGNNIVPCATPTSTVPSPGCTTGSYGYSAGTGYDQATGWGSIDAYNLVDYWGADIAISSSMSTATITNGTSATATITVGSIRGFTGTVAFSCTVPSTLSGVTCSVPSTTVSTSGTTTVTITASSTASTPWWHNFRNLPPAGLGLLALAFMLAATAYLLRKQRFVYAWGAAALLACMLGAVSCGGGGSSGSTSSGGGTVIAAESGTVVVTATSGLIKNQVGIAVTVPAS